MSKVFKKYAKGNIDADLKVISLGMGVQSTAVYLMSSLKYKLEKADYAIFADPGAEHQETYKMLEWLIKWQKANNGIEILINKKRNLYKDIKEGYKENKNIRSIPAHTKDKGIVRRQCTQYYKIDPVIKTIREIYGLKKGQRMKPTEMWLGISTDEIQRMKECWKYNIDYFYPLIYHNLTRKDCIEFFKDNNFPVPVKSSCTFCPFHSNDYWKEIQKENGRAWKEAIAVDRQIRNSTKKGDKDKLYIHNSCKPLEEIDFDDGQLELFEGFNCDEGYCGL